MHNRILIYRTLGHESQNIHQEQLFLFALFNMKNEKITFI